MADWRDTIRNPDCELCPLNEGADHVCLMGSGTRQAKVMIVGEAPGAREDDEHRAFVGPAGQLLTEVLHEAGIERSDCYVTNVAKCRPPGNRTPEKSEIKTCVENYLMKEIEQVNPKYVLLLGNSAFMGVLGKTKITQNHGSVFRSGKRQIMATVHPALVLRNPRWDQPFRTDLSRFGRMTRGESVSPETEIKIVRLKTQLAWLLRELMQAKEISWDIETWVEPEDGYVREPGQDWHGDESYICSIAFTWQEGLSAVVPLWHNTKTWRDPSRVLEYLKPAMEREGVKYVAHNGKFDARWMKSKGINVPQVFDTMLAAHILEENRLKGLKPLSRTQLGAEAYNVGVDTKNAYHEPLRRLCIYNGKDTDYTLRLYHVFREQLRQQPGLARVFTKLMMPASNVLVDVERTGLWLDPDRWKERRDECERKRAKIHAYINQFWPEGTPINLNAPMQVGRLLFEYLGLPIIERTKKDAPSTKESVLLELASQGHKIPTAIIKWRKWNGYITRYLDPWMREWLDRRGRIHSNYKLFGTVTGRLSGEGGIQQVPRDKLIRSIIGAEPGWVFMQADYSQIELRIAFWLANERRGLAQYLRGEDIHMLRAMKMTGKPAHLVAKEERKKAKAVNFGYIYGMGYRKFVKYAFENYDLRISEEDAEKDRNGFFEDYPALRPWHDRQRRLALRYKQVRSPIGRIRHLPDIDSQDDEVKAEAQRQAINSPVQSCASDIMLTSLITMHPQLDPTQARIIGTVHDSILFEIREDAVDETLPFIKETMEDMSLVYRKFGTEVGVPIVVDIEVGRHWGEATHEYKDGKLVAA